MCHLLPGFNLLRRFSLLKSADVKKIRNPRGPVILRLGKTALLRPTEYVAANATMFTAVTRRKRLRGSASYWLHLSFGPQLALAMHPPESGKSNALLWSNPVCASRNPSTFSLDGKIEPFLQTQFECGSLPSGYMTDVLIRRHDEAVRLIAVFDCGSWFQTCWCTGSRKIQLRAASSRKADLALRGLMTILDFDIVTLNG